jgi:uncharacterized membrane protein YozB (DUF420 family)
MGLFGTAAPVLVDINMILQYVTLLLLIAGYVKRKPFKTHGYLMLSVLIITVGTTIFVMAPRLLLTMTDFGIAVIGHAAVGIIAIILGALFAARFIMAVRNQQPLTCGTKTMMRVAFILWIVPVFFGTAMYIFLYL